ncbi:hypothetical protein [Kitasatospora sp. NPDC050463]|uniref:hypothetical protein n=1 Tax=Kitasatospora sp. NPDC050463 TaxID=3155786 RepID=UPI0034057309
MPDSQPRLYVESPTVSCPQPPGCGQGPGRAQLVKCMGRTYCALAEEDRIDVSDVTDITRPLALGVAVRSGNAVWDIHAPDGRALLRTGDLLRALVALRTDYTSSARR